MAWMAIPGLIGAGLAVYNAFSDTGEVKERAKPYDPNTGSFALGGRTGYATEQAGKYETTGAQMGGRQFVQGKTEDIAAARAQQQASRNDQMGALNLSKQAAQGLAPSVAAEQLKMGTERSIEAQMAAAASTRGGMTNLALANREAANQAMMQRQAIVGQAAALRAQEIAQARAEYLQGTTGMRGQDIGFMGTESQFALGQGQLALGSQAQNQAAQLAYAQMAMQTQEEERRAQIAMEQLKAGQYSSAQAQNMAAAQYNAQLEQQKMMGVTGALMGGATAGLGMMGGGGGGSVATQATGTGSALGAGSGSAAAGAGMTSGRPFP